MCFCILSIVLCVLCVLYCTVLSISHAISHSKDDSLSNLFARLSENDSKALYVSEDELEMDSAEQSAEDKAAPNSELWGSKFVTIDEQLFPLRFRVHFK